MAELTGYKHDPKFAEEEIKRLEAEIERLKNENSQLNVALACRCDECREH